MTTEIRDSLSENNDLLKKNTEIEGLDILFKPEYELLDGLNNNAKKYFNDDIKINLEAKYLGNGIEEDVTDKLTPKSIVFNPEDFNSGEDLLKPIEGNIFGDVEIDGFTNIIQYMNTAYSIQLDTSSFKVVNGKTIEAYLTVEESLIGSQSVPEIILKIYEVAVPDGDLGTLNMDKKVRNISNNETNFVKTTEVNIDDIVEYEILVNNESNIKQDVNITDPVQEGLDFLENDKITINSELNAGSVEKYYYKAKIKDVLLKEINNTAQITKLKRYSREIIEDESLVIEMLNNGDTYTLENGDEVIIYGEKAYI